MSEEFDVPVAPGPGTVEADTAPAARCPVMHLPANATGSTANQHWWREHVNLRVLNKNSPQVDPMGADFQYASAFEDVDLDAVIDDLNALMTAPGFSYSYSSTSGHDAHWSGETVAMTVLPVTLS